MNVNFNYFKNKRILITGHSGFKGTWMVLILKFFGAEVYGISLKPKNNSMYYSVKLNRSIKKEFFIDIRNKDKLTKIVNFIKPNFIFHFAAQALVKDSFVNPLDTISTNVLGTSNILEVARLFKHKCNLVIVTSDKCYKNIEQIWGYKEIDEMGGNEAYSASKASCEIIINAYSKSYFLNKNSNIKIVSVRAGNVIGGGDWSENRIIPDCVKSWKKNKILTLNNPNSTRPWQHVLEPLFGYLKLALALNSNHSLNGEAFNFGPNDTKSKNVRDLVIMFKKNWKYSKVKINKNNKFKEQNLLKLDCTKVFKSINWRVILKDQEMIEFTSSWYLNDIKGSDMLKFTNDQIKQYYEKFIF